MSRKIVAAVMFVPVVPVLLEKFAWWLIDVPGWIERGVEKYCDWVRRVVMGIKN